MYGKIYPTEYHKIFDQIDQLDVWRDILGYVRVGQLLSNPFRFDNEPGCYLREYNGMLLFTDFAYPEYSKYTCVHAVAHIQNVGLNTAASIILSKYKYGTNINFSIKNVTTSPIIKRKTSTSDIHFDPYTNELGEACFIERDQLYWSKRYISSNQLKKHNVYSVKYLYLNNAQLYTVKPTYSYYFPENGRMKIYSPYDKEHKWISNTTKDDIWIFNIFPLSEYAIITKSLKDLMVLENVTDFDIYAFQNEGVIPSNLIFTKHYTHVFILYDNDKPGINASKKLKEEVQNS